MASITPLPRRRRRRTAATPLFPADIFVLPLANDLAMVRGIAREMIERESRWGAEDTLASHLELEIYRLQRLGIAEPDIERSCREFAHAAWAIFNGIASDAGVG